MQHARNNPEQYEKSAPRIIFEDQLALIRKLTADCHCDDEQHTCV